MILTRRQFVTTAASGLLIAATPQIVWAAAKQPSRTLSLYHTHTSEKAKITYFEKGAYIPDAMKELNHLLRDFRNDQVHDIDPSLYDQLFVLHRTLGSKKPFDVISAFRSHETNEMLREKSGKVAKRSLHLEGRAIDVSLKDKDLKQLRNAAIAMQMGGVGYYSKRFVHLDTGNVRKW